MGRRTFGECPRCGMEGSLRDRDFSDQAVAALVSWGEIEKEHVGLQMCGECYSELRDVLVERTDEVTGGLKKAS